jgi:hypothetical protein
LANTQPSLFRLRRGQLRSAQRAGIEPDSGVAEQQGYGFPLYRHLGAQGAFGTATRRARTEAACPFGQPLVESVRPVLLIHWRRMLRQAHRKGQ